MRLLIAFIVLQASMTASAGFYDGKSEGWHWYEEEPQKTKEKPKEEQQQPTSKLQDFRKKVEEALHKAVMTPTYGNVQNYMRLQKLLVTRGEVFSKMWMKVLYTNPELDESVKTPMFQAARHVYLDELKKKKKAKMQVLSKTHGLMFFFTGSCAYCHKFVPIVKQFSETYKWSVLPVSMDGSSIGGFENVQVDNGTAAQLNVNSFPTLLAVNPKTGKVVPLCYGMVSQEDLEDRVWTLMQEGEIV